MKAKSATFVHSGASDELRSAISLALRQQRRQISEAVLARVYSLEGTDSSTDPAYQSGLRVTVATALDYAVAAIERDESRPQAIPTQLFAQVRDAARSGVSLDTVLRRYFAGYSLFGDFLYRRAEALGALNDPCFGRLRREQAALLDRLLAAVSAEYERESAILASSVDRGRSALISRLLAGELLETGELAYPLDSWHLALVVAGPCLPAQLREVAAELDRLVLFVRGGHGTRWIWLGGARRYAGDDLERLMSWSWPPEARVAIGEPAHDLAGWRLSHQQAVAALPIARQGSEHAVRYADVATLASLLQDEILAASMRQLYLDPLQGERDGGMVLKKTLRAYFGAQRNSASAASALGVSRNTVTNRLRLAERHLGRSLAVAGSDLEIALRMEEIDQYP